ncbi:MAG: hypothetical protein VKJ02_13185 [Snowella sp.]|nr:hypothetical protein [Snowella sp.]
MKTAITDIYSQRQQLEDCLNLVNPKFTYRQGTFESFLSEFDINYFSDVHRELLTVKADSQVVLSTTLDRSTSYGPCLRQTNQFDQFKAWIGMPNALFEQGVFSFTQALPSSPWPSNYFPESSRLTDLEKENIQKAGYAYLFGNSQLVASYKAVIEKLHAPFEVAVWAIEKIRIEAGSSLIIQGDLPAVLMVGELEIVEGGNITLYSPTNLTVQKLQKIKL